MINRITGLWVGRGVTIDGMPLYAEKSLKVYNHSPDGFMWGYGGSGPAQLALAILLEFTDTKTALRLHQTFKWEVICGLPQTDFAIDFDVVAWIDMKKNEPEMFL